MSITHTTAVRTVLADAVCNPTTGQLGSGGKIKIYSGTPPANAQASLGANTLLSTITGLSFGAAASGISTVSGSTADPSAANSGTATFFRITTSADVVILQGTCGTSGSDMIMNNTTISAGANVSLTGSNTYTAPN